MRVIDAHAFKAGDTRALKAKDGVLKHPYTLKLAPVALLQAAQRQLVYVGELFGASCLARRGNKFQISVEPGTSERRLNQLGRRGRGNAHGNSGLLRLLQKCQEPLARRHLGVAIDQDVAQLTVELLTICANAPGVVVGLALILQRQMLKLGKIVDRHVNPVTVQ